MLTFRSDPSCSPGRGVYFLEKIKYLAGKGILGSTNFWPGKVSCTEKCLSWKGFLGREISALERFLGKIIFLGKVSFGVDM
jgi:hypothetical protein